MTGPLTRPESSAEWRNVQRMRSAIYRCEGCGVCLNRAGSAWGKGYCKAHSRTFPLCMHDDLSPSFDLDRPALDRIIKPAEKAA